jgi:mono/diheme cytochrome c family protein
MRPIIVLTCLLAAAGGSKAAAGPPFPSARDSGTDAKRVFAAKCAGCHGPDLPKPKGRFGYVLDLPRVAGNPEFVIPSKPDESELWVLVSKGEMPPADSAAGPLSPAEKAAVRDWIAAGAPDSTEPEGPTAGAVVSPPTSRLVNWVGKFHLLLLHFPIALMLAAGLGELVAASKGVRVPSPAVQFCLALAALAAVPTVVLGWLHAAAGNGVGSPQLLTAHRWLGTAAGVWLVGTTLAARRDALRGKRGRGTRFALAVGVALVAAVAHVGGLIAHGSDFFDW